MRHHNQATAFDPKTMRYEAKSPRCTTGTMSAVVPHLGRLAYARRVRASLAAVELLELVADILRTRCGQWPPPPVVVAVAIAHRRSRIGGGLRLPHKAVVLPAAARCCRPRSLRTRLAGRMRGPAGLGLAALAMVTKTAATPQVDRHLIRQGLPGSRAAGRDTCTAMWGRGPRSFTQTGNRGQQVGPVGPMRSVLTRSANPGTERRHKRKGLPRLQLTRFGRGDQAA